MKNRLSKILCLFLPFLLLPGCWQEELLEEDMLPSPVQSEEAPPDKPEEILPETFSLPYAPDQTLDPLTCPDGMQQTVASLLYEGLFRLGPGLEAEASLCESFTYDPERFIYVFTLRENVAFSDGSPLTARDVRAALNRALQSERYQARLSQVVSVAAADGAVTVTLNRSNTGFPSLLDIPIIKEGTHTDSAPTGTGPYLFSRDEGGACLIANPSWWQGEGQPVDRVALVEASSQDTMVYRFTSHEAQLITADLTGTAPVTVTGSVSQQDAATTTLQYLGCNIAVSPLDSAALRRALWAGVNRGQIVSGFLSGHAAAAQFPVSPLSSLYPTDLESPFSHDALTQAAAQSGYVSERSLVLLVNGENEFKVSAANHLAETFTAAGIPTETRVLPWEEYTAALEAGNFDLYYGEVRLTADWDLSPLLATGGSLNYGGWADERTDQLLSAFLSAEDRPAAMHTLCAHLQEQAPILPVCFKSVSVLSQAGILEGLTPTAAEPFYNLADCTVRLRET